jgi:hypothetical protein
VVLFDILKEHHHEVWEYWRTDMAADLSVAFIGILYIACRQMKLTYCGLQKPLLHLFTSCGLRLSMNEECMAGSSSGGFYKMHSETLDVSMTN